MKFTSQLTVVEADNAGISVPEDVVQALGGGNHPKVALTLNGYTYRSSIAKMGEGFWIPAAKARRAEGNLEIDTPYEIDIELDTAPRTVDVPDELTADFDLHPQHQAAWESLSYSRQLGLITPALNAKKPETRDRNIAKVIAALDQM